MNPSDDDNRPFPIQGTLRSQGNFQPCTIPWWLAEIAYKHYVKLYGGGQSLERMAQRGGFGRTELISLLRQEE